MSKVNDRPLAKKLLDMKVVLSNIQSENMDSGFLQYGYDQVAFANGNLLYQETLKSIEEQKTAASLYKKAIQDMVAAEKLAKEYYLKQVTLTKLALKNETTSIKQLGIYGCRKETFLKWIKEAKTFYNTANKPEVLVYLEKFGISSEILDIGLQLVKVLDKKAAERADKKGLAMLATTAKNKKCQQLYSWYIDFKKIAFIVFGKDSQQLERLGFTIYSPGYKRKKKESTDTSLPLSPLEKESSNVVQ